ncbi:MAG: hypothetical protein KKF77_03820 [Proteobacteria bacterium]|nr:hypothetical protein [Pseudomonadota bacterium]
MTLHTLLTELRSTASLKEKEAIVATYKHHELVKRYLYLTLSPKVLFYTTSTPKQGTVFSCKSDKWLVDTLADIADEKIRGAALAKYLHDVACVTSAEDYEVFSCAIEKDLRCNVGATIVNEVWPKLIEEHPYMGAKSDTADNRVGSLEGKLSQLRKDGKARFKDTESKIVPIAQEG